jgi:hypothetical protein
VRGADVRHNVGTTTGNNQRPGVASRQ